MWEKFSDSKLPSGVGTSGAIPGHAHFGSTEFPTGLAVNDSLRSLVVLAQG